MTDEDRINAEIDAGPWQHLLVLADLAEERGETEMADGYRWIVIHQKHPRPEYSPAHGRYWFWALSGDEDIPDGLPIEEDPSWGHKTRTRAFRAAAVAVGRWLREEREKT